MEFLDTGDAMLALLRTFGAPTAVVILVGFALAAASWIQLGIGTVQGGRAAAVAVNDAMRQRTTAHRRSFLRFLAIAALFCAISVAGARLGLRYPVMFGAENVDWGWADILSSWDVEASWYLGAAAGSAFLLGYSRIANIRFLRIVLALVWIPVLMAGMTVGAQWAIGFAGSLIAVVLTGFDDEEYRIATTISCAIIATTTLLPIWLGSFIWSESEKIYPAVKK
ncbi:hypothetical protein [Cryobacterium sp. Hb1]|uniref:hypothetical protein n=1 Tax=Cryobacterium sp. Hb1 TaxID=1259147 RepID=UPI00106B85AC|nr:hypothetical protein [Cryobacterium sp. Hb1]TFD65595.1 hypothetical protein E3T38_14250 [Cryobacterium sp. Hb1]